MKMNFLSLSVALLALAGMSSVRGQPDCGTNISNFVVGINAGTNPLTAITTAKGFPPFESVVGGNIVGADIQIACELQRQLGFNTISFVNFNTIDALLAALSAGTVTVAISDISITAARTTGATGNPAVSYMNDTLALTFFDAATLAAFKIDPANPVGTLGGHSATFATLRDTREERILRLAGIPDRAVHSVATVDELPPLVAGINPGEDIVVNAYLLDEPTARAIASPTNAVLAPIALPNGASSEASSGLGVFVNPACTQLLVNIQAALNTMVSNGFFSSLATTFPVLSAGGALPLVGAPRIFPSGTGNRFTSTAPVRNNLALFILNTFCPACTFIPLTQVSAGPGTAAT